MSLNTSPSIQRGYEERPDNQADPDTSFKDLLDILIRGRLVITSLALFGVLVGLGWVVWTPKSYSATATLEVNRVNNGLPGLTDLSGLSSDLGGGEEIPTDLQTQQDIVESDLTLLGAIKAANILNSPPYALSAKERILPKYVRETDPDIQNDPARRDRILDMVRSRLKVSIVKGTRLIAISYTDTDPVRAKTVADAIATEYLERHISSRVDASEQVSQWLTKRLGVLKDEVERAQMDVTKVQSQTGVIDKDITSDGTGASTATASVTRYSDLYHRATVAANDVRDKEEIFKQTQKLNLDATLALPENSSDSLAGSLDLKPLRAKAAKLSQLDLEIRDAETQFGARNPYLEELNTERATLEGQIKEDLRRISEQARQAYELASRTAEDAQSAVNTQQANVSATNKDLDKLRLLAADSNAKQHLYRDLLAKVDQASIASGIRASDITFVDHAQVPSVYSSPRFVRTVAECAAAGMGLGLVLVLLASAWDDRLYSLSAVRSAAGAIPISSLTKHPEGFLSRLFRRTGEASDSSPGDLWQTAGSSALKDSFREFRTILLANSAGSSGKVFIMTGVVPGDNSLDTALVLAAGYSHLRLKVLVIPVGWPENTSGLNVRGVASETTLNVGKPLPSGLGTNLFTHSNLPSLTFLDTNGFEAVNPEYFASNLAPQFLDEVREYFEVILVCCSSAGSAEVLNLARLSDAVVIAVQLGVTRRVALGSLATSLADVHAASVRVLVTNDAGGK